MSYENEVKKFVEEETVAVPKLALGEAYAQLIKLSGVGVTGLVTRAIQRSAEKVAEEFMQNLSGSLQPAEIPDVISAFLSLGRWGEFQVEEKGDNYFVLKATNGSFFAHHISSKKPVCWPIVASIQGFTKVFLENAGVRVEETHCRAKGDDFCRFVVSW